MSAIRSLPLGAPGVYRVHDEMRRALGQVRMDVCAFAGVAPRGAARVPVEPVPASEDRIFVAPDWPRCRSQAVAVHSWDDYRREFGGFEGPGRLPYAVASFFEQGGRKAYVVRIVHQYDDAAANLAAVARGQLGNVSCGAGAVHLDARSEGSWGNGLKAALGFSVTPLVLLPGSTDTELLLELDAPVHAGTLLRLSLAAGEDVITTELRFVSWLRRDGEDANGDRVLRLGLDSPLGPGLAPLAAERIDGDLLIEDGAGGRERFGNLGLSPRHPRYLARVLYRESCLVYPGDSWVEHDILPLPVPDSSVDPVQLIGRDPVGFSGGEDRYQDIVPEDFFDPTWIPGDDGPAAGVHALAGFTDLASVVVPDLYVPEPLPERDTSAPPASLAGAWFAPCRPAENPPAPPLVNEARLEGLLLDPGVPAGLDAILRLQQRVVALAEQLKEFVVLLDVPPGLSQQQILRWRANFRSSYAAAYHPWLQISRGDDARDGLLTINPAAVAAGIIARQEHLFGVPHGPANVLAAGVVKVAERISPVNHDELHPHGINVFLRERDGVRLSAGRTLSRDPQYRQLSVRRLMLMLRRALQQQMHWVTFEPNTPLLWSGVRHMLTNYLRQLFIAGAFKGAREEQAFFVRCDAELNTRRVIDAGQFIAEIGVAPAEPLEFIAVRITRGGDGTLVMES